MQQFNSTTDYIEFRDIASKGAHSLCLVLKDDEYYAANNVYLSQDKMSGFCINKYGKISNLFSLNHNGSDTIQNAVNLGGKFLFCKGDFLRTYYEQHGFRYIRNSYVGPSVRMEIIS